MGAVIQPFEHPAVRAWTRLLACAAAPTHIAVLREREKGTVFRLDGMGPNGSDIVAKHCQTAAGLVERTIYEEILPYLPVTSLHCYGHVTEEDGSCWLFLERAAGEPFVPAREEHRVLAARWLARLHTSAAWVAAATDLPDRGPAHYLNQLRSARLTIRKVANNAVQASDCELLQRVVAQCDLVEAHWREVEEQCAEMPQTLVHGDFRPKNVHVRSDDNGDRIFAMDWETAGWGVPAADIASIRGPHGELSALKVYQEIARQSWPNVTVSLLQRLVEVGKLFRRIAAIGWCSVSLPHRWEKSIAVMRVHRAELAPMIEEARWT